jgi:hypothetical protein
VLCSGGTDDEADDTSVGSVESALKLSRGKPDNFTFSYLNPVAVSPDFKGGRTFQNIEYFFLVVVGMECSREGLSGVQLVVHQCEVSRTEDAGERFSNTIQRGRMFHVVDLINIEVVHWTVCLHHPK